MGNIEKVLYSKEQFLYYHLNRKEYDQIDYILEKNPQLLDQPITKDTKHTLLMRSSFNSKLQTTQYLLTKNPQVNAVTPRGQTALSIAVKKNNLQMVKLLIEKGANPDYINQSRLSIIDFAILPGYLDIATFLFQNLQHPTLKSPQEYQEIAHKYHYRYVDYHKLLILLSTQDHNVDVTNYLNKQKKEWVDPVPDPRESWNEWFARTLEFKESPLVQRNSLPTDLQPQNRTLGKMDIFLTNWSRIDGRKITSLKPKDKREVMSEMGDFQTDQVLHKDYRQFQSAA